MPARDQAILKEIQEQRQIVKTQIEFKRHSYQKTSSLQRATEMIKSQSEIKSLKMQVLQNSQLNSGPGRPSHISTHSKSTHLTSSMKPAQSKQTPVMKGGKVSQATGHSFGGGGTTSSAKVANAKAVVVKNSLAALLNSPNNSNNQKQSNSLSRKASLTKQTPAMCKSQANLVVRSSIKKSLKVKESRADLKG